MDIELIAPNEELVYRPMAVREPFAFGPPRRYPLRRIAHDAGADWRRTRSSGSIAMPRSSTQAREGAWSTTRC